MAFESDLGVIKFLKALDNSLRLKIVELIINSSLVSFSTIHEHLETQIGRKINRGTMSYHLDILVQSNVLHRELDRNPEVRTYSHYNTTDYALEKLEALGLLIHADEQT